MFDPQLHPRIPAGHPDGGQFAFKGEDKFGTLDDDMPEIHLSALQRSVVDGYRGRLFPHQSHPARRRPQRADRAQRRGLNDRGVRTARGGEWHDSTVRNLLARAEAWTP
jgi:hypothetical protein